MKNIIAVLALLLFSSLALADEPIKSIDSFEGAMKQCLLKNKDPAGCLGNTMKGHFSPGNEKLNDVVNQVASVLHQWLAGEKVFAMYPVKRNSLGEFYEDRVYIIEDATGSVIMLETSFVHTLGKWYMHRFNLSSKKNDMQSVLGVDL